MSEAVEAPIASPPRNYLAWGLASTVLCFLPTGLVVLYFGFQVDKAVAEDRTDDAIRASTLARRWLIATVIVGVVIYAILVATFALLGAFAR